ncbi:MAG: RNA polymerase sigma factor RpoD/SigA [Bacteroidota bacterium]|nr:RNA polymerase sigma factor RpoD/SigA [Bacteroidota bacterium]MDP4206273.1 RNA polymerase sigma factor RpoD/SigA [Bacteroidota bacterium]
MRQLKITKQVTNREALSLDKYLQEISKIELLNSEQEVELAKRIHLGDSQSLEKLVKANLRFVVSVSKQYQNQGLSLPDLINEGNLGLIKAAQRFDETRGFKFISYAVWWIRQSIMQALAEQARIVRLPLNRIGTLNKIAHIAHKLEQENQREPTTDEIAELLEVTSEVVEDALKMYGHHVSMDAPLRDEEGGTLLDLFENEDIESPDGELINGSLSVEVERFLGTLNEREAEIIRYYYGLNGYRPHTLDEIAEVFNLTRERVRQLREKAIKKLKCNYRNKLLKNYLG